MEGGRTSLYVGDLLPEVSESMLYDKFITAGHIESVRVCRDMVNKKSLGYAYVNFHVSADALKALDTMNFDRMLGRPMRLMWSQRDPSLRKSGKGNIFIKNLDPSIDNKTLYDTFTVFGPILSCKIVMDDHGSKGYGFVHFESEECAEEAIGKVNGMLLNGKKVYVAKFVPKKERMKEKYKFSNIYVKNFGHEIDDDGLKSLFIKFGNIVSYKVMRDDTGKSKGFGFVSFEKTEDAEKAVNELDGFELNGKKLYIGRAQKAEERQRMLKDKFEQQKTEKPSHFQGVNLYIKNLDDDITEDRLRKDFSVFGNVTSVRIMTQNGRSKGFGFVCFSTSEEASKAIEEMNGRIISVKPLYVALALGKEERRKFAVQHQNSLNRTMMPASTNNYFVPAAQPYPHHLPPQLHVGGVPRWQVLHQVQNAVGYNRVPQVSVRQPRNVRNTRPVIGQSTNPRIPIHASGTGQHPMAIRPPFDSTNNNPRTIVDQMGLTAPPPSLMPHLHNPHHSAIMSHQNNQSNYKQMSLPPMPILPPPNSQVRQGSNAELKDKTLEKLSSASIPEQKELLGERLYAEVIKQNGEFAGKITGMLLELDTADILHLLESPMVLREKVREAESVLQQTPRDKIRDMNLRNGVKKNFEGSTSVLPNYI